MVRVEHHRENLINTLTANALSALIGAAVALGLTAFLHPVTYKLERFSRRFWRSGLIDVNHESDPSIIWAGHPPWIGATIWLPEIPNDTPPMSCTDWQHWALERGGFDAGLSVIEVTIQARKDVSLLIKDVKVRQRARDTEKVGGYILACHVAGAAIAPRRIEANLDWGGGTGTARWLDQSGAQINRPQFTLSSGEFEQLQIWVTTERGWHEWWLELILLYEGRKKLHSIGSSEKPFVTVGRNKLPERRWVEGQWSKSHS